MVKKGKVYLIGAGPGSPDLITIRARNILEKAEVVIYDYLVNPEILNFVPAHAELIPIGRRKTPSRLSQEKINRIMIEKALEGKSVVRLKGGDPFIFGRGGEEALALAEAGIEFEVVPGVTAATGVPAYAGIPLTHRDIVSVLFLTGHEDPSKPETSIDWESIARIKATLVFYMGVKTLPTIVEKLLSHGKSPLTPSAVIHWGTMPVQKTVAGGLKDIVELARRESIEPPSILVVGDVVSFRKKLQWYERKPLFGRTILITRAQEQSEDLAIKLREGGANVISIPMIKIVQPEDWGPVDQAIENLKNYNWIIFTSANGVRFFLRRLRENGKDLRELYGVRIMAIGPGTAAEISRHDLKVDAMPEKFIAESVVDLFGDALNGMRILLPRAKVARDVIPRELSKRGAIVDVVPVYETMSPETARDELIKILKENPPDVITFTSSSTVRNFAEILGKENIKGMLNGVRIACIGPVTKKSVEELGLSPDIMPQNYTTDDLTDAIVEYFKNQALL